MEDWTTIESDPGIFTELIRGIGVKNCQVEELYTLDDDQLIESIQPIYGFIFLFKWKKKQEPRECLQYYDNNIFFCNQIIQNACATQAIISILLNNNKIEIGDELQQFKSFTKDMDSQLRGATLSNSELIKSVHNSFARQEPFVTEKDHQPKTGSDKDLFHFISYVPINGKLYELDGLQQGPIFLGSYTDNNWIPLAREEINKRIQKYAEDEVHFNLMCICHDREQIANQTIDNAEKSKYILFKRLVENNTALDGMMEEDFNLIKQKYNDENTKDFKLENQIKDEDIKMTISDKNSHIAQAKMTIEDENQKKEKYKIENVRRKHNYIPFVIELLKIVSEKGKLKGLVENAKKKKEERDKNKEKK